MWMVSVLEKEGPYQSLTTQFLLTGRFPQIRSTPPRGTPPPPPSQEAPLDSGQSYSGPQDALGYRKEISLKLPLGTDPWTVGSLAPTNCHDELLPRRLPDLASSVRAFSASTSPFKFPCPLGIFWFCVREKAGGMKPCLTEAGTDWYRLQLSTQKGGRNWPRKTERNLPKGCVSRCIPLPTCSLSF